MRLFLLIFALMTAACASSIESALTPQSPVQNCLAEAGQDNDARRACIGTFSRTCIEGSDASQTTGGMVRCIEAERLLWLNVRGEYLTALRARESPSQLALLDAALAEHESWSQTRCAYAASIYEGGSLARLVAVQCLRDAIAEFTIELIGRGDEL